MKKFSYYLLLLATTLLGACQSPASSKEGEHQHGAHEEGTAGHKAGDAHEEGAHEENLVKLSPQQIKAVNIQTAPLSRQALAPGIEANGHLEVPPQNEARVNAYLGANVTRILVIEGDQVRKGQTLAILSHPELISLQQEYQEGLSRMEFLKKDYARKQKLYNEGVSSGKEFELVDSEYKALQSRSAATAAKLKMLHINPESVAAGKIINSIPVISPINGFIKKVNVVTGQYAPPQQELFEVVDNSHIHADLMVFQRDVDKLRKDQKITFTVPDLPGKRFNASIYSIGKVLEEDPKAVHIHAEIDGEPTGLLPGMFVRGKIITDNSSNLAVPEEGIVSDNNKSYIFLADTSKGEFRMTEIIPGRKEGTLIAFEPLDSLPAGSYIVTSGAYYLIAEMKKAEAGHSH